MANQIIDKALAYIGNNFAKTSITFSAWTPIFTARTDGTNVDITIPVSSLKVGNSYTCSTTTWNIIPIDESTSAVQVSLTPTSVIRTGDTIVLRCPVPSGMTGSRYCLAVNRGAITITAN